MRKIDAWISISIIACIGFLGIGVYYGQSKSILIIFTVGVCVIASIVALLQQKVTFFIVGILLSAMLWCGYLGYVDEHVLDVYMGKKVYVVGKVISDVKHGEFNDAYTIAIETLSVEGNTIPDMQYALIVKELSGSTCAYGNRFYGKGYIAPIEDFATTNGRVFAYKKYEAAQSVVAMLQIKKETVTCAKSIYPHPFAYIRRWATARIHELFKPDEGALLAGLILGIKNEISKEWMQIFIATGVVHIVVLSGTNVAIVGNRARTVGLHIFGRKKVALMFSMLSVLFLVLVSGAGITAIRAGLMIGLSYIAEWRFRNYAGLRALLIVALGLALLNPMIVLYDISFHLSFIATAGLYLYMQPIEYMVRRVPVQFELRSTIATTLATSLFTFPYILYAIGNYSYISIVVNICILFLIPFIMEGGILVLVLTAVSTVLGYCAAQVLHMPLWALLQIINFFNFGNTSVPLPQITAFEMLLLYTPLVWGGIVASIYVQKRTATSKINPRQQTNLRH